MFYSTLIRFFAIDFTKILFAKFATGPLGFFGRVEDKDDRFKKKNFLQFPEIPLFASECTIVF